MPRGSNKSSCWEKEPSLDANLKPMRVSEVTLVTPEALDRKKGSVSCIQSRDRLDPHVLNVEGGECPRQRSRRWKTAAAASSCTCRRQALSSLRPTHEDSELPACRGQPRGVTQVSTDVVSSFLQGMHCHFLLPLSTSGFQETAALASAILPYLCCSSEAMLWRKDGHEDIW